MNMIQRFLVASAVLPLLLALMPAALAQDSATAEAAEESASVQPVAAGPATGDTWIDARLLDIDHYAARHRDAFIDELVRYHGAPRALAAELLAREDAWSAGDLYFACALGQVSGRPCRTVVSLRERAPAQPWSEIAGQVGAAPGTAPFQRLRTEIAASYRRWARPLPDAD